MPIATPEKYRAMLDAAREGAFALPAINVTSSTTILAALEGLSQAESDGILQISYGGGEFASGQSNKNMAIGAIALAEFAGVSGATDGAPAAGGGYTLLGHSFGSIITAAAVARGLAPRELVLVNPIGAPALEGPRAIMTRLAVGYYRAAAALPEKLGFALLRNRVIVRVMSVTMAKTEEPALRKFIHDQHDRYFSAFGDRDAVLEAFEASVSHDVREYAPSIRIPVLLVVAEQDDVTPLAAQHRLQPLFDDATLAVIPGVGHLIHYETPAEAAGHIRGFLEGERA